MTDVNQKHFSNLELMFFSFKIVLPDIYIFKYYLKSSFSVNAEALKLKRILGFVNELLFLLIIIM